MRRPNRTGRQILLLPVDPATDFPVRNPGKSGACRHFAGQAGQALVT